MMSSKITLYSFPIICIEHLGFGGKVKSVKFVDSDKYYNNGTLKMSEIEELMGSDLLLQRIREGHGEIAEVGVIVKCNYRGYFYSMAEKKRLSEEPFEECRDQYFQIGEGDCIPGLELALRHSHVGEVLKVFSASKFAFGYAGRCYSTDKERFANSKIKPIPPDCDIEYEVEILAHIRDQELDHGLKEKCEHQLSTAETEEEKATIYHRYHTLQAMQLRKDAGNRWFSFQEYPRAAKAYSRATQFAEGYFNPEKNKKSLGDTVEEASKALQEQHEREQKPIDDADKELVDVYVACLNNLAACKISMKEYAAAKDLCVQVLELSPLNGKALLRAAKATFHLDSYEECDACLKKLLSLENIDDSLKAAAKVEYQKLKKAIADYKNTTKQIQKRIAGKLFSETKPEVSVNTSSPKKNNEHVQAECDIVSESFMDNPKEDALKATESPEEMALQEKIGEGVPKVPITETAVKSQSQGSNNLIILLGTSLAVVVLSIFFAFYSQ